MPKIVIQVAKHEDPVRDAQGRTFAAKVYDSAGVKYTVPKTMSGMFQDGGWYEVFFEDKEFRGNKYKEIQTANPTAPVTTASAVLRGPDIKRARTHESDEAQINKRHRLTTIFNTLAAVAGQLPLTYEGLRPIAGALALIYDALAEENTDEEGPTTNSGRVSPQTKEHPHSAEELDDEVPF